MATDTQGSKFILYLIIVIVIAGGAFYFLKGADHRTSGEKVGNAIDTLSDTGSVGKAADQLGHRTPAQQAGDSIERKSDEVKDDMKNDRNP